MSRRRKRIRPQAGFTLIEMTVVISILSIVMLSVFAGFDSAQRAANNNMASEQQVQQAEVAMQVITKDLRATALDQQANVPLLLAANMTATSVTFDASIDTTSSANNTAAGNVSAYSGCPDQITITGGSTPGVITETRIHPSSAAQATACAWPTASTSNMHTRTLIANATLGLVYLTYVDPTSTVAPSVSSAPATTASVQVTLNVWPPNNSVAQPVQLTQTVPLLAYVNYLNNN